MVNYFSRIEEHKTILIEFLINDNKKLKFDVKYLNKLIAGYQLQADKINIISYKVKDLRLSKNYPGKMVFKKIHYVENLKNSTDSKRQIARKRKLKFVIHLLKILKKNVEIENYLSFQDQTNERFDGEYGSLIDSLIEVSLKLKYNNIKQYSLKILVDGLKKQNISINASQLSRLFHLREFYQTFVTISELKLKSIKNQRETKILMVFQDYIALIFSNEKRSVARKKIKYNDSIKTQNQNLYDEGNEIYNDFNEFVSNPRQLF